MRKDEVRPPMPYRRRNGVAFFFRSFCFLFWFFFVLFKEGNPKEGKQQPLRTEQESTLQRDREARTSYFDGRGANELSQIK